MLVEEGGGIRGEEECIQRPVQKGGKGRKKKGSGVRRGRGGHIKQNNN